MLVLYFESWYSPTFKIKYWVERRWKLCIPYHVKIKNDKNSSNAERERVKKREYVCVEAKYSTEVFLFKTCLPHSENHSLTISYILNSSEFF